MNSSTAPSTPSRRAQVAGGLDTISVVQLSGYAAIIAVGAAMNLALCASLCLKKRRKLSEYFILNLTVADLLTCCVGIPLDLVELVLGRWPYGAFLCKLVYPFQTILIAVSVGTLLCMALERYRAILTPLKPKLRGKLLLVVISLMWLVSVLLVCPYILVLRGGAHTCTEAWPGPESPKAFTMCIFLLLYAIPLCIITAAYIRIITRLRQDSKRISGVIGAVISSDSGRRVARARFKRNTRVVMVFIFAVACFALCFLPYHVMWLWHDFGRGGSWEHFSAGLKFSQIVVYLNSAINPFIFGTLIKRLRSCKEYFKKTVKTPTPKSSRDETNNRQNRQNQQKRQKGAPMVQYFSSV